MSSINAKKFMGLFEGVRASIAFVFIRRMRAIVLASMGCGYHIVPASMGFVITTPACGMCHIRLLRRAPNPYAAKRDEER